MIHRLIAQTIDFTKEAQNPQNPLPYAKGGISLAFTSIMTGVMAIGVIMVLFFLVSGALDWIMSGGEKGKIETARGKITGAVIGLIVLASVFAILTLLQNFLGVHVIDSGSAAAACQGPNVIVSNGGTCCSGQSHFANGTLICN